MLRQALATLFAAALLCAGCSSADKPPPEVAAQGHMTWEIIPERTTVPEGEPIRAKWVIRNTLGATIETRSLPADPVVIYREDHAQIRGLEPVCGRGGPFMEPPTRELAPGEEFSGLMVFATGANACAFEKATEGRHVLSGPNVITASNGVKIQVSGTPVVIDVVAPPLSTLTAPEPDEAWNAFFTRTSGWTGGDIGASVALGPERTLWLFGDSWIGPVKDNRHADGTIMVRNAMAVHPAPLQGAGSPPPFDSAIFLWSRPGITELQPQWLGPADAPRGFETPPDKTWYWPMCDGVVTYDAKLRQRLVLFAAVMGPAGAKEPMWDFRTVGGVICIIDNFNDPPGDWRIRQVNNPLITTNPRADGPSSADRRPTSDLWPSAVVYAPYSNMRTSPRSDVHLFGTRDAGANGRQLLFAFAYGSSVEDPSTWRFRTKDGWSRNPADAAPIADGFPTEFTIRYLEIDGRGTWVAIHSEPMLGHHIQARTALNPQGPWSAPKNIYLVPEVEADKRLITYAHKAHPQLSRRGELLVSYVVNSSDFGQIMGDASLYRPRFVRVPLSTLPKPPE